MAIITIELTQEQVMKLVPFVDSIQKAGENGKFSLWDVVGQVYLDFIMPDSETIVLDSAKLFVGAIFDEDVRAFNEIMARAKEGL